MFALNKKIYLLNKNINKFGSIQGVPKCYVNSKGDHSMAHFGFKS